MTDTRRIILFVNAAHAFVHYVILIFPTAVLAISAEWKLGYGELVPLATGTFVAFGLLSLPVGWLVNIIGPRRLLVAVVRTVQGRFLYFRCGRCVGRG